MTFLEVALLALVALVVVLLGTVVLWQRARTRARLAEAEARVTELAQAIEAAPIELRRKLGDSERPVIAVEILNHMELAASRYPLARTFGGLAPKLLRREVTKRAVRELHTTLEEVGVKAEVRVHDGI